MSKANAKVAYSKTTQSVYAARKGSSFERFVYRPGRRELIGVFKAEGKKPLTAECVTQRELASFLQVPIRLRGQALQQLIEAS